LGSNIFTAIVKWVMTICSVIIFQILLHAMPLSFVGGSV
jgi:hypothetical protein